MNANVNKIMQVAYLGENYISPASKNFIPHNNN